MCVPSFARRQWTRQERETGGTGGTGNGVWLQHGVPLDGDQHKSTCKIPFWRWLSFEFSPIRAFFYRATVTTMATVVSYYCDHCEHQRDSTVWWRIRAIR